MGQVLMSFLCMGQVNKKKEEQESGAQPLSLNMHVIQNKALMAYAEIVSEQGKE